MDQARQSKDAEKSGHTQEQNDVSLRRRDRHRCPTNIQPLVNVRIYCDWNHCNLWIPSVIRRLPFQT